MKTCSFKWRSLTGEMCYPNVPVNTKDEAYKQGFISFGEPPMARAPVKLSEKTGLSTGLQHCTARSAGHWTVTALHRDKHASLVRRYHLLADIDSKLLEKPEKKKIVEKLHVYTKPPAVIASVFTNKRNSSKVHNHLDLLHTIWLWPSQSNNKTLCCLQVSSCGDLWPPGPPIEGFYLTDHHCWKIVVTGLFLEKVIGYLASEQMKRVSSSGLRALLLKAIGYSDTTDGIQRLYSPIWKMKNCYGSLFLETFGYKASS
ncbi:hypothetical protein J6590_006414 [Homalodisca vitripennis]|nr:hypothetical protein J6590_006414 [Homalodisca vitripennis]